MVFSIYPSALRCFSSYLGLFLLLATASSACEPGPIQLARWLTRDLDVGQVTHHDALTARAPVDNNTTKLFRNGTIVTMAKGNFSIVDALVVQGDEVKYTGTATGAVEAAGTNVETVDLGGRTMLPGFVEPHLHLILSALADNYLLNMSPLKIMTLDQAISTIQNAISSGKVLPGGWIAGYGYDPSRVVNHPDLTIDILDNISRNVSIYILNQSGHVAYVNSAAFKAAGITAASVAGNPYYQQVNGSLTGIVFEQATVAIGAKVPTPNATALVQLCIATLNKWASKGCTTIFDAGIGSVGITDIALMSALPAALIPQRMHGALSSLVLANLAPVIKSPPFIIGASNISITSIKFWADGSTQGFTASVNEPYLHPPATANPYGVKNYANATVLQAAMDPWLKAGFQLVVHSNGDNSTDMVLDAYEMVFRANPARNTDVIHRIEHFTVTRSEQLSRAKALGLSVSHTIGHVNYWGSTFVDYVLGTQRAERIDPLREDEEVGLLWSVHSDSPVTDVDPLLYLKTATTRMLYPDGSGVLGTTQQVSLLSALKAVTVNPARQMGMSAMVGSLEVGKKADMVVLDGDLMGVSLGALDQLMVRQTWIGGRIVYEKT